LDSRCSTSCGRLRSEARWWSPSTTSNGSTRLRLACSRSPFAAYGTSRSVSRLSQAHDPAASLELEQAFPEERLTRVSLGPLSLSVLHRLLEERLGLELTRPEVIRVQEASAGNPFFALELGRELVRTNTRPVAGRTLPVSESLHELLDGRRAVAEASDVVLFAAALARPTISWSRRLTATGGVLRQSLPLPGGSSELTIPRPLPPCSRPSVTTSLERRAPRAFEAGRRRGAGPPHGAFVTGPDAVVASLDAAAEHAAARGGARLAADFPSRRRVHTCRSRRARQRAASLSSYRHSTGAALLEHSAMLRPAERADVLLDVADARSNIPMLIGCRRPCRATSDDARSAQILAYRFVRMRPTPSCARRPRAALEKAERAATRPCSRRDRACRARGDVDGRDHAGLLRRREDRGAAWPRSSS
jgi:hypothetical protein